MFSGEPGLRDAHFSPVLMQENETLQERKGTRVHVLCAALPGNAGGWRLEAGFSPEQRGKAGVHGRDL